MKKMASIISSAVVMLFSLLFIFYSLQYPFSSDVGPGPGLFPFWLSLLLFILSIFYMVVAVRGDDVLEAMPDKQGQKNILFIIFTMILYLVLLNFVGTTIAGTVFLFLLLRKSYKWPIALAIALGASLFLFLLFSVLLSVHMPVNKFGF